VVDEGVGEHPELRYERFIEAGFEVEIALPLSSEALIDESEFESDERLPYWAELWPSALALARFMLTMAAPPPRAIELGCGVGLPSLALLHLGADVLATDYYEDALRFARLNAARNHLPPLRTRHLDWRRPPTDLGAFPLVLAADVLYEARNADALRTLLPRIVAPGGEVVIADPRRIHLDGFLQAMADLGWQVETIGTSREPAPAGGGRTVEVDLIRLVPREPAPNLPLSARADRSGR
jgi:predicted nicotinamide N-methyase